MTAVTDRFFVALDTLIASRKTKLQTFCKELGADKRNFVKQQQDHSRAILKPSWLTFIVCRYGVSSNWLLTGRGAMFA